MLALLLCTVTAQTPSPAPQKAPAPLQALVATSGEAPAVVLDRDPSTSWHPAGESRHEGVLFRFEAPVTTGGPITMAPCGAPGAVTVFVNGFDFGRRLVEGDAPVELVSASQSLVSFFVRLDEGTCVGDITFGRLAVTPPRAVEATVAVSSVLAPADAYHPGFLFDGRLDFGWVEGATGPGTGESITLTLAAPASLTGVELWNGYQRSDDHFAKNARIKRATVTVGDTPPRPWKLADVQGPQRLTFPAVTAARVTITVDEVYPGSAYPDLVVSELRLVDGAGPLAVATGELAARARALEQQVAGTPLASVVNTTFTSVCGGGVTAKFRTNASFVVYRHEEDPTGSIDEVLDGAWILKGLTRPHATIELFGRGHRTETSDSPYAAGEDAERITIIGGPVKVTRVEDLGEAGYTALAGRWKKSVARRHVSCPQASFAALTRRGAIVVEGRALTALLARN